MKREKFNDLIKERVLFLDGAYGTEFFKRGYKEDLVELLNIKNPEAVRDLQNEYINAGVDILLTNTFSANRLKLKALGYEKEIERINVKAVEIAKSVARQSSLIFGDIGPCGTYIEPFGEISFEDCYNLFYQQAKVLIEANVDGIILETFSDIKELKAAILAIRDIDDDIPLIAQMTFLKNGISITGTSIEIFTTLLNDLDVDVVGINCSLSCGDIIPVFKKMTSISKKPISIEPNASNPGYEKGKLIYNVTEEELANFAKTYAELGANIIGGCCGFGPNHIKKMIEFVGTIKPVKRKVEDRQYISSRTIIKSVYPFLIVGEKINASANKKIQNLFLDKDFDKILPLVLKQQEEKAGCLDINFGKEDQITDEIVKDFIQFLDKNNSLPLSLDIMNTELLSIAMKEYPARCVVNSSIAKRKELEKHLKLIKKFGGMLVILIMKKDITEDYKKRIRIIEDAIKIVEENKVDKERIFFDPLIFPINSGKDYRLSLKQIEYLNRKKLKSIVGLSNLSYGIKEKENINSTYLALALEKGLNAAICDTSSMMSMKIIEGYLLLNNLYNKKDEIEFNDPLLESIISGDKDHLLYFINEKLKEEKPIDIIEKYLSKKMEEIGKLYSEGKIFLPHLLIASETSQIAFDLLNSQIKEKESYTKGKVLLATVEKDIHDIGKKIIATILKCYGFEVFDIGKNVSKEKIYKSVLKFKPDIIGLSAMMTSTIEQIKIVSNYLKSKKIYTPIIAGGTSMNESIAKEYKVLYAKDAIEAIKLCNEIVKKKNILLKSKNIKFIDE